MGKIDFIGIGAGRSGSTWLSKSFVQHPDILFSSQKSKKELSFFNTNYKVKYLKTRKSNYHKGISWYLNQFPTPKKGKIRGEFTPWYLFDKKAHVRIKKHFPNIKLIAVLRNPVERIYSSYFYSKLAVTQKVPNEFTSFIKDQEVLNRFYYYPYLKKYLSTFPRNRIHIILLNNIKNKPKDVLKKVYGFLGVDSNFVPANVNKKINTSNGTRYKSLKKLGLVTNNLLQKAGLEQVRDKIFFNENLFKLYKRLNRKQISKPKMKPQSEQKLIKHFNKDINKTEKLINKDLSIWLK